LLSLIEKPTLLLNPAIAQANIAAMAKKIQAAGAVFRPHFKTHQSAAVGQWFKANEIGVKAITVSSLEMASYFAQSGWKDILVAFPVNLRQINVINSLLAQKVQLQVLVESPKTALQLNQALQHPITVWIKIDTGYHRTGIEADKSPEELAQLLNIISACKNLNFSGFLTHAGHTYTAQNAQHATTLAQQSLQKLLALKKNYPNALLSAGDTPTCSLLDSLQHNGIDQWRPGNFVFYDLQQYRLSACNLSQIALCLACPVVAVHAHRNEAVLYAGAVHLSKDAAVLPQTQQLSYGLAVALNDDGTWFFPYEVNPEANYIRALSQEHAVLVGSSQFIKSLQAGQLIGILPAHACLTAQAMGQYILTQSFETLAMMR
jgi:D-serine deaminase-like pyridoxal phosphate-dependent protein